MGEPNVTQVEGLDFTVKDHSSSAAEHMAKSFEHVHKAAEGVTQKLGAITHHAAMSGLAMVGLGIGFREIASKASEANLELEDAAKKIAGVQYTFGGWKAGTTGQEKWAASLAEGTEIVEKLEASEGKLKMTRAELADIYKVSFALGERHNLTQEQMLDVTEKLGAAQKVLGVNAEAASNTISKAALTGRLRPTDDFSKSLFFAIGNVKAFAKLSEEARFQKLQKAMSDLMPAAEGMGKGVKGAMFDAREGIEDLTRDISGPVFKEVTKDFASWAHEITKVAEGGNSVAKAYGDKLVKVFGYLKDATAFIADHWKAIAGIFVATKFAGAMQGLAGRFATSAAAASATSGLGTAAGTMHVSAGVVNVSSGAAAALGNTTAAAVGAGLKPGIGSTVGKIAGMAAKVGMVTEGLGLFYVGLQGAAKMVDEWQTGRIQAKGRFGAESALGGAEGVRAARHMEAFRDLLSGGGFMGDWRSGAAKAKETMASYQAAYGADIISKTGAVNQAMAMKAWEEMSAGVRAQQAAGVGLGSKATGEEFVAKLGEMVKLLSGLLPSVEKEGPHVARKADKITNIYGGVHITQDFKDRDPARIFHRTIEDVANNPTTSGVRTL
jgi:hypothetical protein